MVDENIGLDIGVEESKELIDSPKLEIHSEQGGVLPSEDIESQSKENMEELKDTLADSLITKVDEPFIEQEVKFEEKPTRGGQQKIFKNKKIKSNIPPQISKHHHGKSKKTFMPSARNIKTIKKTDVQKNKKAKVTIVGNKNNKNSHGIINIGGRFIRN